MTKLRKGDIVQIGIPKDDFIRRARSNSSSSNYIKYMAEGGIAEVVQTDDRSVRLKSKDIDESSNWFHIEWFTLAEVELNKIKQESQRL